MNSFFPITQSFDQKEKTDNKTTTHRSVLIAIKNTFVSRQILLYSSSDRGVLACFLSYNFLAFLLVCFFAPKTHHLTVPTLYFPIVIYCLRKFLHCQIPSIQQLCMVISFCRKLIGAITQLRTQMHRILVT